MSSCLKQFSYCIPQRWIVCAMGFLALVNAYTLRVCLSIAITKMALPLNKSEEIIEETCPPYREIISNNTIGAINTTVSTNSGHYFEWSEYTQGLILSAFYWGYFITHLPGGMLSEKFGPKYTLGFSILITAILTIMTPAVTVWGGSNALIFLRFLMGLCEGVIQSSISYLLAQWIPISERSTACALVYSGSKFGIVISIVSSGLIMGKSSDDWPFVFHLFGTLGIVWFVFWIFLSYNNPKEHPFISATEKTYLIEQLSSHTHSKMPPFPWKHAFTSKCFISLIIAQSGQDFCNYLIMTDLPKYMQNVLNLPVSLNGYASSVHNITSWMFCVAISWLSDRLVIKKYMSKTQVLKLNMAISSLGPQTLLIFATYLGCNVVAAVSLITLGLTLSGSSYPAIKVNILDLSPNYAGTIMGVVNGIAAPMGVIAPYAIGVLAPNQTLSEWQFIFYIAAALNAATLTQYLIFASGKVQEWNNPEFLRKDKEGMKKREENVKLLAIKQVNDGSAEFQEKT